MKIPDEVVAAVKAAANVVELVEREIKLKRSGSGWVGLCPFHQEKSPSFQVKVDGFHCYGCGEGGSAVDWLMKREALPFGAAVRKLGAMYGIPIPEREMTPEEQKAVRMRKEITAANARYVAWCHTLLMRSAKAAGGRELLKRLGITSEMAKAWKLGYAPNSLKELNAWARAVGISDFVLEAAGILGKASGGGHYARFRERVMLPVVHEEGSVMGCLARAVSDQVSEVWIHSGETIAFKPGRMMFGWDKAKREVCRQGVARLVKDPLEVIQAHALGELNVVCALGGLGDWQARALKRNADLVVLADAEVVYPEARVALTEGLQVQVMVDGQAMEGISWVCSRVTESNRSLRWRMAVGLLKAAKLGALVFVVSQGVRDVAKGFAVPEAQVLAAMESGEVKWDAQAMMLARWGLGREEELRLALGELAAKVEGLPEFAPLAWALAGKELPREVVELPVIPKSRLGEFLHALELAVLERRCQVLKAAALAGDATVVMEYEAVLRQLRDRKLSAKAA